MCLEYSPIVRLPVCILSIVCGLIVLATFRISLRWSQEFRDAKRMLLFSSCSFIVATIAFMLDSNSSCIFQSLLIQIGGVFYVTFLAIELKYMIENMLSGKHDIDEGEDLSWLKRRHLVYHAIVLAYGVPVVIYMGVAGKAGRLDGSQTCVCWFASPLDYWYFSLIPVGIAELIVIYCYGTALRNAFSAMVQLDLQVEMSAKSKCVLRRLVAIPTIFFLLWVPTTIYRVVEVYHNEGTFLPYFWLATFPSAGFCDAVVFVFSDSDVLYEWKDFLRSCWKDGLSSADDRPSESSEIRFSDSVATRPSIWSLPTTVFRGREVSSSINPVHSRQSAAIRGSHVRRVGVGAEAASGDRAYVSSSRVALFELSRASSSGEANRSVVKTTDVIPTGGEARIIEATHSNAAITVTTDISPPPSIHEEGKANVDVGAKLSDICEDTVEEAVSSHVHDSADEEQLAGSAVRSRGNVDSAVSSSGSRSNITRHEERPMSVNLASDNFNTSFTY